MAFVFYQHCQKENCNEMKQLKNLLEKFSNGGVCLLSSLGKKCWFVCGVCNTTTFVDFENICNVVSLQWICEKGSVSPEITKINELRKTREKLENECQKESERLLVLRDQTRVAAKKLTSTKKELVSKNICCHIIINTFLKNNFLGVV